MLNQRDGPPTGQCRSPSSPASRCRGGRAGVAALLGEGSERRILLRQREGNRMIGGDCGETRTEDRIGRVEKTYYPSFKEVNESGLSMPATGASPHPSKEEKARS